jgi:hypothetical protein
MRLSHFSLFQGLVVGGPCSLTFSQVKCPAICTQPWDNQNSANKPESTLYWYLCDQRNVPPARAFSERLEPPPPDGRESTAAKRKIQNKEPKCRPGRRRKTAGVHRRASPRPLPTSSIHRPAICQLLTEFEPLFPPHYPQLLRLCLCGRTGAKFNQVPVTPRKSQRKGLISLGP